MILQLSTCVANLEENVVQIHVVILLDLFIGHFALITIVHQTATEQGLLATCTDTETLAHASVISYALTRASACRTEYRPKSNPIVQRLIFATYALNVTIRGRRLDLWSER
eukprot:5581598-Amphidinium_carterae.1